MAVLKCTVCGGTLEVNEDMSVGVCEYCDATVIIPKNLEKKGNLYNRAVFLRQNNEFDKAVSAYEDILKEDNLDADAHWGLVLSKYGIEYVADPHTNERIPTCHRTQSGSILSDPDYLAALEYSDMEARRVIEREAKRIGEIQAKILEISRKEPPYDIFICYKESDDFGNRTVDSTIAQDLYYELDKKGYKVFFARKTLESKLGTEYEPIIYAALNSAKVMIVLGTKPENFNAVWVRNEWSRFNKMSKDTQKVIIPAYRGMSPYELPAELSAFQSQDMSKIGFMQDLMDGIERCMRGERKRETIQREVTINSFGAVPLERLLQNGQTYLRLNNYTAAEEVYKTITKDYPEDYRGWWGLIVCKTLNFSDNTLDQSDLNVWFGYAKQLADQQEFDELEKIYVEYTRKVSVLAATEEIKTVNGIINSYSSKIKHIEQKIAEKNQRLGDKIQEFHDITEKNDGLISDYENRLKKAEKTLTSWKRRVVLGALLICIGILIFNILKIDGPLVGSVLVCIGWLSIFFGWLSISLRSGKNYTNRASIKSDIAETREHLQNAEKSKKNDKAQYDKELAEISKEIEALKGDIVAIQEKIAACKSYIDLGEEKISSFWFAEKCRAFGIQQSVDSQIIEYRNNALE